MTTHDVQPEPVKVVYVAGPSEAPFSPRRRGALVVLALTHLAVAGGMFYLTWWPIDKWVGFLVFMYTPIPLSPEDAEAATTFFGGFLPPDGARPAPDPPPPPATPPGTFSMARRQIVLPITKGGWETLATASICALALAGGACLGRLLSRRARRRIAWLIPPWILGLIAWGYMTWMRKEWGYTFEDMIIVIGGIVLLFLIFGLASGRRLVGWSRVAAISVILAAFADVIGLELIERCEALKRYHDVWWTNRPLVFGLHSAYGWMILIGSFILSPRSSAHP